jgi:hypothetical protein
MAHGLDSRTPCLHPPRTQATKIPNPKPSGIRSLEVKVGSHLGALTKFEEGGVLQLIIEVQRLKGSLTLTLIVFLCFYSLLVVAWWRRAGVDY